MAYTYADLALAARHVRRGEGIVARQEALIERMKAGNHDPARAEYSLGLFKAILDGMRHHLEKIEAELGISN